MAAKCLLSNVIMMETLTACGLVVGEIVVHRRYLLVVLFLFSHCDNEHVGGILCG